MAVPTVSTTSRRRGTSTPSREAVSSPIAKAFSRFDCNTRIVPPTKVVTAKAGSGCTVTFQSSSKYGAIVDKASVVNNGYARALVGGGYVLELRALLYPPGKSAKLNVVFSANDQGACDKVANALRKT